MLAPTFKISIDIFLPQLKDRGGTNPSNYSETWHSLQIDSLSKTRKQMTHINY